MPKWQFLSLEMSVHMIIFCKQWSLSGFYKEVNALYLKIEQEKEHLNEGQDTWNIDIILARTSSRIMGK